MAHPKTEQPAPEDLNPALPQAGHGAQPAAETYESATIDADGHLVIVKTGGQTVVVRKQGEQIAFSPPTISAGRTAVAAQARFANCCTSYDIPLERRGGWCATARGVATSKLCGSHEPHGRAAA